MSTIDLLAQKFNLTEEERKELLPSGRMPILNNRVGWTLLYLRRAGLLESTRRGFYKITQTGLEMLAGKPSKVGKVLVQMGYGGSIKEAGEVIGRSGDEGIDGTIKEDVLGLDVIYIQAKKRDTTVGRPEVQKFAGALQGRRARKGIFITTGSFSKDAVDSSYLYMEINKLPVGN